MKQKKWTILYYANGNNEYEPEMCKSMLDMQKIGSNENINLVMEIGRIGGDTASLIRPGEWLKENHEKWAGVRRYFIMKDESQLMGDLGMINMADPKNLYDFIRWGIENYPAEKYMLILGGHGAAFVGTITDYSQEVPYLMGSREMCRAINMILKDTGKAIDILVMDICYMNLVEIMYELGQEPKNTVKNVLTYIEKGPVSGLPYGRVLNILEKSMEVSTNEILKNMIDTLNFDLIAIEINHGKLKRIKRAANDLAYTYLTNKNESVMKPFELLVDVDSDKPWSFHAREFQKNLSSIILHYRRMGQNSGNLINIIFIELKDLIKIYSKLSFAKNNYWVHLINNKEVTDKIEIPLSDSFKPTVIKPDGLRSLIEAMNSGMSKERIEKIFDKLVELRGWKWSE